MMLMSPQLLTIPQVSNFLSCTRQHVYKLISAGELPVVDISAPGSTRSTSRVRQEDLDAYLDRARIRPTPTMKG